MGLLTRRQLLNSVALSLRGPGAYHVETLPPSDCAAYFSLHNHHGKRLLTPIIVVTNGTRTSNAFLAKLENCARLQHQNLPAGMSMKKAFLSDEFWGSASSSAINGSSSPMVLTSILNGSSNFNSSTSPTLSWNISQRPSRCSMIWSRSSCGSPSSAFWMNLGFKQREVGQISHLHTSLPHCQFLLECSNVFVCDDAVDVGPLECLVDPVEMAENVTRGRPTNDITKSGSWKNRCRRFFFFWSSFSRRKISKATKLSNTRAMTRPLDSQRRRAVPPRFCTPNFIKSVDFSSSYSKVKGRRCLRQYI